MDYGVYGDLIIIIYSKAIFYLLKGDFKCLLAPSGPLLLRQWGSVDTAGCHGEQKKAPYNPHRAQSLL